MDTKPKQYTMLATVRGSRDGITVETFTKGETYELDAALARQFFEQAAITEAAGKPNPADAREKKVTGPAETKVVTPAENKDGEAGVDPDTQRVEELVAVARDHYGLDVDSTMDEGTLRAMIEQAQGDESDDAPAKKTRKRK